MRTRQMMVIDGLSGQYVGYVNTAYYHRGYAPFFEKSVADRIMADYKEAYEDYIDECGEVIAYDIEHDCYINTDPNGDIAVAWIGEDIETVDGVKHLYPFGEGWMWDIQGEVD